MSTTVFSIPRADDAAGGWTVRRLQVVRDSAGLCARCGRPGADTATPGWSVPDGGELVAAHTRCVVGLGPPLRAA